MYKQATDLEHMRNQTAMYLGGKAVLKCQEYLVDDAKLITSHEVELSPAALKCFDEILVNAIDQYTLHGSNIWVDWSSDHTITVENDKSSISLYEVETTDKRRMMSIQMIFGEFRTSSNFDSLEKATGQKKYTGGVFGTGAKGVNAFSTSFEAYTCDLAKGQKGSITWTDCMSNVGSFIPEATDNEDYPMTRITFRLNFKDFDLLSEERLEQFRQLCYFRTLQTTVFCQKATVHWNGEPLRYNLTSFLDLVDQERRIFVQSKLWSMAFWIGDFTMSLVNGIYVKEGSHLDAVRGQIIQYVKPRWIELKDPKAKALKLEDQRSALKLQKEEAKLKGDKTLLKTLTDKEKELKVKEAGFPKFDRRMVDKYLAVMLVCYMERPSFTGQRKDKIDSPIGEAEFQIPPSKLDEFWTMLQPLLERDIAGKEPATKRTTRVKTKKYTPAKNHGPGREAHLLVSEGDSADGMLLKGINTPGSQATSAQYGTFSVQGVTMNVRKEILHKNDKIVRSQRLQDNERLAMLVQILGLDYSRKYDTLDEISKLNYRSVIIATDQDEDGKGNIRSLLFNFFWTLWPALVKQGYVRYLVTPIVRALHRRAKEPVREFTTEQEYHQWSETASTKDWEIVYYKGLGSHGEEEITHMFKQFHKMVVQFTWDDKTEIACDAYFGDDPNIRKLILARPARRTEEECLVLDPTDASQTRRTCSATDHLNTSTKSFQLYNIQRHIKHLIDGGLPSRRKVWAGSRKKLSHSNERIKIFQLAGEIAKIMNYHHGDASLNSNLIGETQAFPGAREFPLLLAMSITGSRRKGGLDAGKPRYVFTKLNKHLSDALFPPQDDYLLDYTWDDGCMGEPVFYVPTLPLAIMENYTSPGHGWLCSVWARSYTEVVAHIKLCLAAGKFVQPSKDFGFCDRRYHHQLERVRGVENSTGTYTIRGDTITITELPPRVWNEHWLHGNPDVKGSTGIADEEFVIDEPNDTSTDTVINIEIKCQKGFLASKSHEDIVKLFKLRASLKPNLNFIGLSGAVEEYQNYWEIFQKWYDVRRQYYDLRVERLQTLLRLKILMIKEQIRFIKERETLGVSKLKKDKQNAILKLANYPVIDHRTLESPLYTKNDKLEELVLRGPDASWDYIRKMDTDDLSEEGLLEKETLLKKLQDELLELQKPDASRNVQLKELDKLDQVVRKGHSEGWNSWEPKHVW